MVQFASYLRRVLCKTRLIFPRINGPNEINLKKAGRIRFFKFIRMRDSFYSPSTVSYSLGRADFAQIAGTSLNVLFF